MNNDYIWTTTDINHVAYLISVGGFKIQDFHKENKNGKEVVSFVFYESETTINNELRNYINSEIAKFNQSKNELLSLIRQNKLTKEEMLGKVNG